MSLSIKIIVSLVIAAVVSSATTLLQGNPLPDLPLLLAFCIATVSTVLLVSLPASKSATTATERIPGAATSRKSDSPREFGKVKWFNVSKGFGFIVKDDGEEIFVHFRSIRGEGRRGLRDGQRVSFVVADSEKGPQAEDVTGED
ncbi:MAG: cold shock domain-containing protein [Haliea sp.]|jgi:CspA family cold shock protein|nr:cold shock domain-containing protein [Haliea sp.]